MNDARSTRNHTLQRTLGATYFTDHPEYYPATDSKAYSLDLEKEITAWMTKHLKVAYCAIPIGRKEFEDGCKKAFPSAVFK